MINSRMTSDRFGSCVVRPRRIEGLALAEALPRLDQVEVLGAVPTQRYGAPTA